MSADLNFIRRQLERAWPGWSTVRVWKDILRDGLGVSLFVTNNSLMAQLAPQRQTQPLTLLTGLGVPRFASALLRPGNRRGLQRYGRKGKSR